MSNPIIPKTNSTPGAGAPSSLYLGELASNRSTGKLYLGCDSGIVEVGGAGGVAGTTVTNLTGDGTTTDFAINGYSNTTAGNYMVSVGGIDQRPTTDWTITSANGGTISFASAPPNGAAIVVRAFTGASGGGGSGDATSLQGRALASTAPTDGQAIVWDQVGATWKPGTISGGAPVNWLGTWSNATQYTIGDGVAYNGSSYVATAVPPTATLPTDVTYWQLVAAKGDIGATGPQGASVFVFKGEYYPPTLYAVNDVVTYNGSSYVALVVNQGLDPTRTDIWALIAEKGSQGPQGQQGNTGSQGPSVYTFRGNWNAGVSNYYANDVVTNAGSSYVATQAVPIGFEPPFHTEYWQLLAAKGDTGAAGQNGTNGTNGQGFAWKGTWVTGGTYVPYDVVFQDFGTVGAYICIAENPLGNNPENDPAHWNRFA